LESPRRVAAPFMPAQILPTADQYRLAREEEERSEFRRGGVEGGSCIITVDALPFVCEYDGTNARDGLGCLKKQRFAQETIPTKPSGVCNNDKKKICGSTSSERSEV